METQTDLAVEIDSLDLVDTHEHLLTEDQWAGDNAKLIEGITGAGERGWGDPNPDILQDLFMNYVQAILRLPVPLRRRSSACSTQRLAISSPASPVSARRGRQHSSQDTVKPFG